MRIRNDGCCVCGPKLLFLLRGGGRGQRSVHVDGGGKGGCPGYGYGYGYGDCAVGRRKREGRGGRRGDPGMLRLIRG